MRVKFGRLVDFHSLSSFIVILISFPLITTLNNKTQQHSIDEIAEAMTIAEQRVMSLIQPSEFFHSSSPLNAPTITRLAKLFNSVPFYFSFLPLSFPFPSFFLPYSFVLILDKLLGCVHYCFEHNASKNNQKFYSAWQQTHRGSFFSF